MKISVKMVVIVILHNQRS